MRILVALCTLGPALAVPQPVLLTVEPGTLTVVTGQCNAEDLVVRMENAGSEPVYADAALTAPEALRLKRALISTWLPPGYTRSVAVSVRADTGTGAGRYRVRVSHGDQHREIPVTVTVAPPEAALIRQVSRVTASSFRALDPVCAIADDDPATFWGDATNRQWPDWHQLDWGTPRTLSRVELTTLPAERSGLRDWDVQVRDDDGWRTVATVRGNTATTVASTFPARTTRALRILTHAANTLNDRSRIAELAIS